jgi:hypothetical protein
MRIDSVSRANSGIAQCQHGCARGDCRKHHGEKLRVDELLDRAEHDPS